ncbi:MAG: hypothetical protein NkDv07_0152 [Candidatus Improbicoccus devescovinae]|nr:MAG: hypothetical protein NkDv07_0152 [Candidatus Improbicoccus devescovinae]
MNFFQKISTNDRLSAEFSENKNLKDSYNFARRHIENLDEDIYKICLDRILINSSKKINDTQTEKVFGGKSKSKSPNLEFNINFLNEVYSGSSLMFNLGHTLGIKLKNTIKSIGENSKSEGKPTDVKT